MIWTWLNLTKRVSSEIHKEIKQQLRGIHNHCAMVSRALSVLFVQFNGEPMARKRPKSQVECMQGGVLQIF